MLVSVVSTVVALVAVSIYAVDMERNPEVDCANKDQTSRCNEKYYAMVGASFCSCQHYKEKGLRIPTLLA